jgi:hypothetical protein
LVAYVNDKQSMYLPLEIKKIAGLVAQRHLPNKHTNNNNNNNNNNNKSRIINHDVININY